MGYNFNPTRTARIDAIREYVATLIDRELAPGELGSITRLSDQDLHLIVAAFDNADIPDASGAAHRVAEALEASGAVLGEDERRIIEDALRDGRA